MDLLPAVDREEDRCRDDERQGIEQHRDRSGERLDEDAAERWAGHLGDGARRLQPAVRGHDPGATDERRHERAAGEIGRDAERAGQKCHDVELREGETPKSGGEGHRPDDDRVGDVRDDHDRPARQPIDPGADEQAEHERRRHTRRHQQARLGRTRTQHQHGGERECEHGDLAADRSDGEPGPELDEIGVTPQRHPQMMRAGVRRGRTRVCRAR